MISPEKLKILIPLQKMPKNVGDLGRLIVAQALKSCPKSKKSPNLVTLFMNDIQRHRRRHRQRCCVCGLIFIQPASSNPHQMVSITRSKEVAGLTLAKVKHTICRAVVVLNKKNYSDMQGNFVLPFYIQFAYRQSTLNDTWIKLKLLRHLRLLFREFPFL